MDTVFIVGSLQAPWCVTRWRMHLRRWPVKDAKTAQNSSRLPGVLVPFIMLGSIGCHSELPPRAPIAWTTSKTKGCDLERIWSHTLDGLADLTDAELTTCESACKRGDREACVGAGLMLYAGATARKNTFEARRLFHQQCKAKVGPGCIALWMSDFEEAEAKGLVGRVGGEGALFHSCVKGERHACEVMARYHSRPRLTRSDVSWGQDAAYYQSAACRVGSLAGCTGLGVLHLSGSGVPKDFKKAADIFQQQCQKGHVPACTNLGVLYNEGKGVDKNAEKALALLRNACDGGSPEACFEFGKMHWFTDEAEYDYEAEPVNSEIALTYFHKACLGGMGEACHKLAFAYRYRGQLLDTDDARAMQYDEAACKRRVGEACHDLGEQYYDGRGVKEDSYRAAQYFELACSHGNAASCHRIGQFYLEGEVIEANLSLARTRFVQACTGMDSDACYKVGRMMALGLGGFKDERSALRSMESACEGRNEDACDELKFYSHYRTFRPSTAGETEWLYLRACHGGKMRACIDLGYMYRDFEDGALHPQSTVLFQKACDAGAQEGCLELGEAYFEGRGVTQDEAMGLKIDTDACRSRYAWACYILGVRYRDGLGVSSDSFKAVLLLDDACPKIEAACRESAALRARMREELEKANQKLEGSSPP